MSLLHKNTHTNSSAFSLKCNNNLNRIQFIFSKRFIGENSFLSAVEAAASKAVKLETCSVGTANEIVKGTKIASENTNISFHFRSRFNDIFSLRFVSGNLDQIFWSKNLTNLRPNHHVQLSAQNPVLFDLLTKKILTCEEGYLWASSLTQLKVRGLIPLGTDEFISDFLSAQENFIKRNQLNQYLSQNNHLSVYFPDFEKISKFNDDLEFDLYSFNIPTSIIIENLHLKGSEIALNSSNIIPTQHELYAIENTPDFLRMLDAKLVHSSSKYIQNYEELCEIVQTEMLSMLNFKNIQLNSESGLQTVKTSDLKTEAMAMIEHFNNYPNHLITDSWIKAAVATSTTTAVSFSFLTPKEKKQFRKDMVEIMKTARSHWLLRPLIPMLRRFTKKHFF